MLVPEDPERHVATKLTHYSDISRVNTSRYSPYSPKEVQSGLDMSGDLSLGYFFLSTSVISQLVLKLASLGYRNPPPAPLSVDASHCCLELAIEDHRVESPGVCFVRDMGSLRDP